MYKCSYSVHTCICSTLRYAVNITAYLKLHIHTRFACNSDCCAEYEYVVCTMKSADCPNTYANNIIIHVYTHMYNIVDMVYMYMYNLLTSLFEEVLDSL